MIRDAPPLAREAYNLGMSALLFALAAGIYLTATTGF